MERAAGDSYQRPPTVSTQNLCQVVSTVNTENSDPSDVIAIAAARLAQINHCPKKLKYDKVEKANGRSIHIYNATLA